MSAPDMDYIAVSSTPVGGTVEIVAVVLGVVAVLLLLRALVIWSKNA